MRAGREFSGGEQETTSGKPGVRPEFFLTPFSLVFYAAVAHVHFFLSQNRRAKILTAALPRANLALEPNSRANMGAVNRWEMVKWANQL